MFGDHTEFLFIINPIAGTRNNLNLSEIINSVYGDGKINYKICLTEARNHGRELAQKAVEQGIPYIIAAGGDGTINEVASELIYSNSALGVIALGSGNGFARHLRLPLDTEHALYQLKQRITRTIDTGLINDRPFLCTAGIGFEAQISYVFDQVEGRGFKTYAKSVIRQLSSYEPLTYHVKGRDLDFETKAFTVCFANAAQYGNNFYISPEAKIDDGKLNLNIIEPFPRIQFPSIARRFMNKKLGESKYYHNYLFEEIEVSFQGTHIAHIDGDPVDLGNKLKIKIEPLSLKVMI